LKIVWELRLSKIEELVCPFTLHHNIFIIIITCPQPIKHKNNILLSVVCG